MAQIKDRMNGEEPTSREIRDNIGRTRAQMDATVDAIEEKLSPGELVHEAWGLFRGGSSSSVSRVLKIARQYPMPAALISLGLGWMAYESTGGSSRETGGGRRRARYADDAAWISDGDELGAFESARPGRAATSRRAAESAMDSATDLAARAGQKVGEVAGSARDMAGDVADSVRRQTSELGREASELGQRARRGMSQTRTGFWDTLEDQPLVIGAATLAAGLLVGLLLPSTPQEDELMGKTRDSLLEEFKGLGHEVLQKGQHVAAAATETLKQSAEARGLGADTVVEQVRGVGREVVDTVRRETENAAREMTDRERGKVA
jgi:hypothetical protein